MTPDTPPTAAYGTARGQHGPPHIRRGTARRLGIHSPLDLRDGVTITRHHLNAPDRPFLQDFWVETRRSDRVEIEPLP